MALKFRRYRGDTFRFDVAVQEDDGSARDLTEATIRFSLGPYNQDTEGVLIERNDLEGKFSVTVSYVLMENLTEETYQFDVELTYANGFRETLFVATLILSDDITP
jgi:hypothetical protein